MKVMLIFPPQFDVTMPHLALPCLTAVLRQAGHEVIQKDVNIESYDIFLSKEELEKAYMKVVIERKNLLFSGVDSDKINRVLRTGKYIINQVENAKRVFRSSKDFYKYAKYVESLNVLNTALDIISLAYYPSNLSFYNFSTCYSPFSSGQIVEAVQDEEANLYIDFYRRFTLPQIKSENPKVLGISISVESQIIPGLTLAWMAKQVFNDVHVVIGGNYFSRFKDELKNNYKLFSLFDSIILYEGETSLLKLVECVENNQDLSSVPNLIFNNNNSIVINASEYVEDLDTLPTPCFEGLPLDIYLTGELILPIYASRGCYWGKCAFCSFHAVSGKCRYRNVEKVLRDIKNYINHYKCKNIAFVDEAIHPNYLSGLSNEIIKKNIKINWFTHTRFEKQYDKALLKGLSDSGCKGLAFGLESASNRVLEKMDKGTTIVEAKRILIESKQAGISNHVSFFIGFPGETLQEAFETLKFIISNIRLIDSIAFDNFRLMRGSTILKNPDLFEIEQVMIDNAKDLVMNYEYEVTLGIDSQKAEQIVKNIREILYEIFLGVEIINSNRTIYFSLYANSILTYELITQTNNNLSKSDFCEFYTGRAYEKLKVVFCEVTNGGGINE